MHIFQLQIQLAIKIVQAFGLPYMIQNQLHLHC